MKVKLEFGCKVNWVTYGRCLKGAAHMATCQANGNSLIGTTLVIYSLITFCAHEVSEFSVYRTSNAVLVE